MQGRARERRDSRPFSRVAIRSPGTLDPIRPFLFFAVPADVSLHYLAVLRELVPVRYYLRKLGVEPMTTGGSVVVIVYIPFAMRIKKTRPRVYPGTKADVARFRRLFLRGRIPITSRRETWQRKTLTPTPTPTQCWKRYER